MFTYLLSPCVLVDVGSNNDLQMPPKKNTETAAEGGAHGIEFTAGEMKLLDAIFKKCSADAKPKPNAEFEDIAQEIGMKNGKVVSDRYRQILNKFGWFLVEGPSSGVAAKKTPGSRKKKAAPVTGANIDDEEATLEETPTKKRKVTKMSVETKVSNPMEEQDTYANMKEMSGEDDAGDV